LSPSQGSWRGFIRPLVELLVAVNERNLNLPLE